ncbi:MAG: hypothetical protein H6712_32145 [Myxococcales bacterium]|nr:hypothetical protein [Myxococcales bacterium]MCB9718546.1 hypothetical protein [Myxococcales bacterium]
MRRFLGVCLASSLACGGGSGDGGSDDPSTSDGSTSTPSSASDGTGGSSSDGASPTSDESTSTSEDPPPPLQVIALEDLGLLPLPSEVAVGRDGGQGGLLGGRLLWTFGDTFLSANNPIDGSNLLSATGAWSTPEDPLALVQPVDEGGFPAQLIPYTPEELAANQADPFNGWALWPGMMIDTGAAEGLVVFQRIKRSDGIGYDAMGIGTARIAVDATVATRDAEDLFAPPEPLFMPGCIVDGEVLAFSCDTIGFLEVGCMLARAPVELADQREAYEFHDGVTWQPDIALAATVLDEFSGPPSISYNPYLQRYLAISGQILSSTIELRTADDVAGPWGELVTIEVGEEYLAPLDPEAFNYVIIEHVELRSPDGREIVLSYSRPTEPFQGDVRLMRVTLG